MNRLSGFLSFHSKKDTKNRTRQKKIKNAEEKEHFVSVSAVVFTNGVPAKQERCKLLCLEPRQHGQAQDVEAVPSSTPPWGKLVLTLSPLSCSIAKMVILCSSCHSAKQSCAMVALGSKLEAQEKAKCLCKARSYQAPQYRSDIKAEADQAAYLCAVGKLLLSLLCIKAEAAAAMLWAICFCHAVCW